MRIKIAVLIVILFVTAILSLSFGKSRAQGKQSAPTPTPTVTPTTSPKPTNDEVIRVDTELVSLTATVTDKNGRYRADLKQSDFAVCRACRRLRFDAVAVGDL